MDQTSTPAELQIRKLVATDLPFAQTVRELAGWNQTDKDWLRFIEHEPDGCFLAEWNGQPAGTVTTTAYGTDLAWIGMMLVHPDFRRRGIATELMTKAIDYLKAKEIRCIKLDATPDGEPVYARLGFQAEWRLNRWEKECALTAKVESGGSAIENLASMDVEAFGTKRLTWLQKLERDSRWVRVREDGFGMVREGMRANYVGPIMAHDPAVGCSIARELIDGLNGRTFWDIPCDNEPCVALANELGFEPVRDLLRMWLGENVAGDPRKQFALGDPATG